jgi:hypothetical protein
MDMSKSAWTALWILAAGSAAMAQDALVPTHISNFGEITATFRLRYDAGQGNLKDPTFELDLDVKRFFGELQAGVGLGHGFEVEATLPYQFQGTFQAEQGGVEFEQEQVGLGDLTLAGNYRLVEESKTSPQVIGGLLLVLPFGNDDLGATELRIGGVTITQGDEQGLSDDVFKIGFQAGVSKKLEAAEVYGLIGFLVATEDRDEGNIEVDLPNVFTLTAGAKMPLGATTFLDLRTNLRHVGEEVEDDPAGDSTEEAHVELELQARFYFTLGGGAAVVLGAGVGWIQDHAVVEESNLDVEGLYTYGLEFGIHIHLGLPVVGK